MTIAVPDTDELSDLCGRLRAITDPVERWNAIRTAQDRSQRELFEVKHELVVELLRRLKTVQIATLLGCSQSYVSKVFTRRSC